MEAWQRDRLGLRLLGVLPEVGSRVLSIAAGVTLAALEAAAPGRPVVRAMPNTGALVGRGVGLLPYFLPLALLLALWGLVDYATREARSRWCEEEVRLNRRLAPDLYLGVWLEKVTGRSWLRSVATGAVGVAWEEFRQWRGMEPNHPTVREYKVAA